MENSFGKIYSNLVKFILIILKNKSVLVGDILFVWEGGQRIYSVLRSRGRRKTLNRVFQFFCNTSSNG